MEKVRDEKSRRERANDEPFRVIKPAGKTGSDDKSPKKKG